MGVDVLGRYERNMDTNTDHFYPTPLTLVRRVIRL